MFFALLFSFLSLDLAEAQAVSDTMALELTQYTALRSLLAGLNCTAPKCVDFEATDPCPARQDFEDPERIVCVNGSVIEIHLNGGLAGSINGPALGVLTRLTVLELLSHALSTIPSQIGRLTALEVLDLASCGFTGTVPSQVSSLTNLGSLTLASNRLTGTLPAVDTLTKLTELFASNNAGLGGSIPAMPTSIRGLFLHSCAFTALPPNLSALSALTGLYLQLNRLSGAPPLLMSSSTFRTCFLQTSADTNCFDCPSFGVGSVGPCVCRTKNATTCAEIPTLTSVVSADTPVAQGTSVLPTSSTATASEISRANLTDSPTPTFANVTFRANVTTVQETSVTPTSTSSSGNFTTASISRADLGGLGLAIGLAAVALFLVGLGVFCIVRRFRRRARDVSKSTSAELKPQKQPTPASDYVQIVISPSLGDYDKGRLEEADEDNEHSITAPAHSKSNYDVVPTQPQLPHEYDNGRIG
jgi:hypothetical protein